MGGCCGGGGHSAGAEKTGSGVHADDGSGAGWKQWAIVALLVFLLLGMYFSFIGRL